MIIFYSGSRSKHISPEDLLAEKEAGFMLTYSDFYKGSKNNESVRRLKQHKTRMKQYDKKRKG